MIVSLVIKMMLIVMMLLLSLLMMMMMMMMLSNVDLIFDDVCHQRRFLNHKWVLFFFSQEFIWEKKMTGKFSDCVELLFKETTEMPLG